VTSIVQNQSLNLRAGVEPEQVEIGSFPGSIRAGRICQMMAVKALSESSPSVERSSATRKSTRRRADENEMPADAGCDAAYMRH
jgi:hypothetical protein